MLLHVQKAECIDPYPGDGASIEELVTYYFSRTFTAKEIIGFLLFLHNIVISRTTLKRILKRLHLKRRGIESPLIEIVEGIHRLRRMGAINVGYRTMWKLLNMSRGIIATKETVRIALVVIDRSGVIDRTRRRLNRRCYNSGGPNFCIHVDGYDKLKPYGIAIHGCVDGFSRKILWLTASQTNNNPRSVAYHFVKHLKKYKRVPRMVRTDPGTENVLIHRIQMGLRFPHVDNMSGINSVTIGRSTANQRIEMMWSFLMPRFTLFWKGLFTSLIEEGHLNNADPFHLECVRFCFLPIIQRHLDEFREVWNTHRIRAQRRDDQPCGIPDVMYFQPLIYGRLDISLPLPCEDSVLDNILEIYIDSIPPRGTTE